MRKRFTRCYRCGRASKLFKCKHCGNYYCYEHSDSKMPLTPSMVFNEKNPVLSQLYEKEWRKGGHPCVDYGEWKLNELKEKERELNEKVLEALDKMKEVPLRRPSTFTPFRVPWKEKHKPYPYYKPPRKIPLKTIIAIAALIIGIVIYYNFEKVSQSISGLFLFQPICEPNFVKIYESTASFGVNAAPYCNKTCVENYNSTSYKVIEPNETSKLTVCYCYMKNCSTDASPAKKETVIFIPKCDDGTLYDHCSTNKPLYCLNGTLIKNVSSCGCPTDEIAQGDSCISKFEVGPKEQTLNYVFRGINSSIKFTVYAGLNDYLAGLSRSYYCDPTCPSDTELQLRYIDEDKQKEYLIDLVNQIKSKMDNKDNQVRIAISLVQKIPYDWIGFKTGNLEDRYPYEVIYDNTGICGEKSRLLAFILRDLGYGVVLFSFKTENHMAVGIECSEQYSYKSTGYCFIETTAPSITTDTRGDYVGVGKLTSMPDIIKVSDGISFESVSEEYSDAKEWNELYDTSAVLGGLYPNEYNRWTSLVNKYGIEILEKPETQGPRIISIAWNV